MDNTLYNHPLYKTRSELLENQQRVILAYERAKAVAKTWNLSLSDILHCSTKFWDMQNDPILVLDVGCNNILACHINLFIGTLARFVHKRPDLKPLIRRALDFDFCGNFLLSEIDHGLDILNLETTATKTADGYILNTPHEGASKFMPPTTPIQGFPKIAIVMANLIVEGINCGIHPFIVPTSDSHGMLRGVTSKRLPPRSGSSPLDFALTTFDNVLLDPSAFLGTSLSPPLDRQAALHKSIWRIGIGSMALAVTTISAFKMVACIGTEYSFRRHVRGKDTSLVPIISFRSQQLPVLYALAITAVLDAWRPKAVAILMSSSLDPRSRHGMAVIFKATTCRLLTSSAREVGERLGAQGTFGHNLVSQIEMDARGISIAEGDILVLCIRLFSELLQGRYTVPSPTHMETLLARHSASLFTRYTEMIREFPNGHRDAHFNSFVLPQSERVVASLGHALAYSAALDVGLEKPLLDLYELAIIKLDPLWYHEQGSISESGMVVREDAAVKAALPHLLEYANALDVRKYVSAPILDDRSWEAWVKELPSHVGGMPHNMFGTGMTAKL